MVDGNANAVVYHYKVKHIMSERNVLLKNVKHPFLVVSSLLNVLIRFLIRCQVYCNCIACYYVFTN